MKELLNEFSEWMDLLDNKKRDTITRQNLISEFLKGQEKSIIWTDKNKSFEEDFPENELLPF